MRVLPDLDEVLKIAQQGEYKALPLSCEILSDICTPIEALRTLKARSSHCFILESVAGKEKWGRWTFLGFDPLAAISLRDGVMRIGDSEFTTDDPDSHIRKLLAQYKSPRFDWLPAFTGGLVGYFAYDYFNYAEPAARVAVDHEECFNDLDLMLFDKVIAFDNFRQKIVLIANITLSSSQTDVAARYSRAVAGLKELADMLRSVSHGGARNCAAHGAGQSESGLSAVSRMAGTAFGSFPPLAPDASSAAGRSNDGCHNGASGSGAAGRVGMARNIADDIAEATMSDCTDRGSAGGAAAPGTGAVAGAVAGAGAVAACCHGEGGRLLSDFRALFNKEQFCSMVEKARKYIYEGDIFQVVLSNRLDADFEGSLFNTYRVLRTTNPSPYMFYFSGTDVEVAGASPETLVRLDNGVVHTFPLAGTRPRGATEQEDLALERELLSDEKEIAEHNMLVDLGRNDLGRICSFGTVVVEKLHSIERYSHVMHIGSTVRGQIRPECDALDAISSVLPAGTLSGAPKIRACQIIGELENNQRGIYGGAIGYIDFSGNMDTCIAIRLAYRKNGRVFVRSGAGIVADSVAEKEHQECINKAQAVVNALKMAQDMEEL